MSSFVGTEQYRIGIKHSKYVLKQIIRPYNGVVYALIEKTYLS
ncbi:hypothetical protein [Candidatus Methylopumilus turicensis]|nr:hypothetical protein [Candidatus Methylopumilus turicensis]